MANRRPGGYGGGRPNFNSTGPNFNSGSVNPWQGGNVPGNQYNNGNPSNLLSQLSEPQAQLALALTKLLQPQQQVPSLLSMNTNPPMANRGFGGPGNFNRNGPGNMNNRRPQNVKPFNKMNNRNDGFKNNQMQRRPNRSTQPKVINKNINKPQRSSGTAAESKDSKNNKPSSANKASPTKSQDAKKSDTDEKVESSAADATITSIKDTDDKSEDIESGENKKRDWKEEKNDDPDSQVNAEKEVKEEDAPSSNKEVEPESEKMDDDKKKVESVYDDIPKELLQCFICQKRMWDAKSFENHIKGRAHQQMCEKVDDSYRIKADMMRESIRLSEEKNNIEMERMKRLGKKTKNMQLSRCAMCDLEFYGQLFLHRKSTGHQKLKQFLHPKCLPCNKEFPTRMEWDNHRHTPEHLRKKAASDKKQGKPNKEQDDGIMLEEESFIVFDVTENDDIDEPNAVLDISDNLPEDNIPIPSYKANRAVGSSLIESVTGFFCKPCSKFFITEKASQLHTQTKAHYDSFVAILNEKNAENEERKRKAENEEDDEGNWKRRKTAKDGEAENENVDQSEEKKKNGNDLYDPLECDNDNDNDPSIKEEDQDQDQDQSCDTLNLNESSLCTDPNDIDLNSSSKTDLNISEDIWKEVDTKVDEILEEAKSTPETSPVKARPSRPQRAVRGRRHN